MKVPTLTGTNFEEFDLAFTATFRRQNALIVILLDYLLRPDAIVNYNAAWNYHEKKIMFLLACKDRPSMMMQEPFTTF